MPEWIKLPDKVYFTLTVHEVKCPMCGYKETFHHTPPKMCYICEEYRDYKEDNNG